jgi:uncharacterized protein (TIGR02145 family)
MKTRILLIALLGLGISELHTQTIMNIHQSNGTVLQIPLNTIDSITYTINNPGNLAIISTLAVDNINATTATSGGNISSNGGTSVTQRGVCWSTTSNPTTANNTTNNGSGTGSFTSNMNGLTANSIYYIRAYAINSAGTTYGNELSFTTTTGGIVSNPGAGVTFNGYTYTSVVLGNGQEWMAENLRTATYANGDPIPNIIDSIPWSQLNTPAWCNYDNSSANDAIYGKLYNWYTVSDPRNVCPAGWHVPTDEEWTILTDFLGGESVAGGKMKTTTGWEAANTGATNESGFSGLPGGSRSSSSGSFSYVGYDGYWWSSSENDTGNAWSRYLGNGNGSAYRYFTSKRNGFSVRCLRD